MTLGPNEPVYDPITHRPTPEFIREQARDHVGYDWTSRPGTINRNIVWTDEDTATYMDEYRAALARKRAGRPGPITAAVDYIPDEKDVDPDTLAEGKGKQDVEARDMRDDNAGDRSGVHTSSVTASRNLQDDSLTVHLGNRKLAHWEGASLQAAIDDGTLDPRRIEASAIEAVRMAGLLKAADATSVDEFDQAVHAYLQQIADQAEEDFTTNEIHAEPLDDPEWLAEITPQQVGNALAILRIPFDSAYPGALGRLAKELRSNPQAYTSLDCVNLSLKPGEIQSYSLGEQEIPLFTDPQWQALIQQFSAMDTQAHLGHALDSYRGMLQFSATSTHLKLRHNEPVYALLNLGGKRWVRYITPAGAQALLAQSAPGGPQ
jgi:hypothetical protein